MNEKVWPEIVKKLSKNNSGIVLSWIKSAKIVEVQNDTVVIAVNSSFARDNFARFLEKQIIEELSLFIPNITKLEVYLDTSILDSNQNPNKDISLSPAPEEREIVAIKKNDNPYHDLSFENFIVGSGNNLAYAASLRICSTPGKTYNPLFLYGPAGVGKTHLLQAICHEINQKKPGLKVLYVSCDDFTKELVWSIQQGKTSEFTKKYRGLDFLLIDDLQFLQSKEKTQEEFFHIFNSLHQSGKQIVLSSDRPPKSINMEDRMLSRFEWGMVVDVQIPDYETRLAIIFSKAQDHNIVLIDSVAEYLAENITQNVRELEGALNKLIANSELRNIKIDLNLAEEVLGISKQKSPKHINTKTFLDKVASFYMIKIGDITGSSRQADIVKARQISMYILKNDYGLSYPQIARVLGNRDHTTIMHGFRKIKDIVKKDDNLKLEIQALKNIVN